MGTATNVMVASAMKATVVFEWVRRTSALVLSSAAAAAGGGGDAGVGDGYLPMSHS